MYVKADGGAVVTYPYTDWMLLADNPDVSFPADMDDNVRAEYNMHPVAPVAPPEANPATAVSEGEPQLVESVWTQTWIETPRPFSDRQAAMLAAVNTRLVQILAGGYSHDFGNPHGVKVLQTRDAHDRINWLTSQASYAAAVAAEQGAVMGAQFRTEDNTDITLSYADGLGVLLAMAEWGASVYAASWTLKNAINVAQDNNDLDQIDIEAGWP